MAHLVCWGLPGLSLEWLDAGLATCNLPEYMLLRGPEQQSISAAQVLHLQQHMQGYNTHFHSSRCSRRACFSNSSLQSALLLLHQAPKHVSKKREVCMKQGESNLHYYMTPPVYQLLVVLYASAGSSRRFLSQADHSATPPCFTWQFTQQRLHNWRIVITSWCGVQKASTRPSTGADCVLTLAPVCTHISNCMNNSTK